MATTQLTPVGGGRRYAFSAKSGDHLVGILTQATAVGGGRRYGSFAGKSFAGHWVFDPSGSLAAKGGIELTATDLLITVPSGGHPVGILTQPTAVGGGRRYSDFTKEAAPLDLDPPVELNAKGVPGVTGTIGYGIQWPLGTVGISAKGEASLTGTVRYFEPGMFALDVVSLSLKATPTVAGDVFGVSLKYGDIQAIVTALRTDPLTLTVPKYLVLKD